MNSSTKKLRKLIIDRGTGIFPKYLFIGFALIGAILIWILKSLSVPQLAAVIFPVSFIILYCVIAYHSRLFYISEEKIGDNAYYLGFLYTLSSLSYALYVFSSQQNAPEFIISSFGIALWSTIIGIACRVFLSQLRQDPNDIEKEARARISETASILTSELHQAGMSFNTYRRTLQQSMEEAFININEKVDACLQSSTGKIAEIAEGVVARIDNKFEDFNENAKKINQSSGKIATSLDKASERFEKSLSSIESFGVNLDLIAKEQTRVVEGMSNAFGTLILNVQSLSAEISSMKKISDSLVAGGQSIDNVSSKINPVLAKFTELLSLMSEKQELAIKSISNHADALRDQLDRSRKYTEQTHQSLSEMTRTLADKLQ